MDLSLVPLDDLISELQDRSEGALVLLHVSDNSEYRTYSAFSGAQCLVLGMMEQFKYDLLSGNSDDYQVDRFGTI